MPPIVDGPTVGQMPPAENSPAGMPPLAIVKEFNVLRDLPPILFPCFIPPVVHELVLRRPPETLHRRVVVAVSLTRDRGTQPELPQLSLVVMRAILGATSGVINKPWCWALGVEGLHERTPHEVRRHPGVHRMADHLTGVQILDAGEIQPTFRGWHVREVGDPGLVWSPDGKRLVQHVLRYRQRVRLRSEQDKYPGATLSSFSIFSCPNMLTLSISSLAFFLTIDTKRCPVN